MNHASTHIGSIFKSGALKRGAIFGFILLAALFAFEIFNYTTTQFALADILGENLRFLGVEWATILALAFCGIDFAGIARLFTPQQDQNEPVEVWYLFSAWLLAAAMNAVLTWWGVSVAIRTHQELSTLIVSQAILTKLVPIFVALLVWLIRVLIIGTFSMSGDRIFSIGGGQSPIMAGLPSFRSGLPKFRSLLPMGQKRIQTTPFPPQPDSPAPESQFDPLNIPPFLSQGKDTYKQ